MARTVDDRVVSASFETSKFEAGTQKMLSSLDQLKKSMNFQNAGKGLEQLNAAANRVNLSHIANGVDTISHKLNALRLTAIATFASIASRGIAAGANFIKQFTFAPVIDGLHEYENQLNSVQTILANTKDQGTNLKDVNGALNQLNQYADKTIYNFGQMTKNIGTFTAAGVDLNTSVKSIKGIANLAALSGSSSQQASTAMYQLSQAIAAGRVSLQDWNSVVNAGMGGAVFQKSLMRTAEAMGALKKGAVEIDKATGKATINGQSFRESIMAKPGEQSWLTSDVLTNTLKQFSGDLSNAQLKAQGFNDAQIKAIRAQAKTALDAATQVKTFSQLVDTTKEAIGSGWAQTFQIIFGDFGEAKKLWTGLADVIGGFVKRQANARNEMLKSWKKLGGRDLLIKGLKQAFTDLMAVLKPIQQAFREIFPARTGKALFEMTKRFSEFMKKLQIGRGTAENLRRIFAGLFAILDIGKQVLGGVFHLFGRLFGAVGEGNNSFLSLGASMGDWLVALDKSLKKGQVFTKIFDKIGDVLVVPIHLLNQFGHALAEAFGAGVMRAPGAKMGVLQKAVEGLQHAWERFVQSLSGSGDIFQKVQDGVSEAFSNIGQAMADGIKNADMDSVFKVLEVGLLAGIGVLVHKVFSGGLADALSGGALGQLAKVLQGFGGFGQASIGVLEGFTGQMKAMQRQVQSKMILNIAIAVGILAASLIGLSLVDPDKLNGAMAAITIMFGELLGAMAILDKIGKSAGFVKMPVITASMILLAGAIDLLAIAVFALSRLSWEELAKGLGAISVLLVGITAASGPLGANAPGMIRAGTGITIIAVAMNILAKAVKSFGTMDMPTLAKGIGGIAIALTGIGLAANTFPSGMVAIGVGLIAVGAGLKLIAGTIQVLGNLDMSTLAKGIGSIAVAIAAIGVAMQLMPGPSMVITAAGLVLVGVALGKVADAIGKMGGMSIEKIAKGLGTLAASLALLALGLIAMQGSIGGAAALTVAAAGIAILAPALKSLGDQSWGQIIKGLVALAAAFALLGVAGVVLAPVAPAILALGAALIAVGAGLALAGAGVFLIGTGLSAVAVAGPAAIKILVDALVQLSEVLPTMIKNLVEALVSMLEGIAKTGPRFVKAVGQIISLMAQAIVKAAPQLAKAFVALITAALTVLRQAFPDLVKTGFEMLKALLKGISKNIASVVKMVATIVGKFLGAIASNLGKIITGGAKILAAILKGIANGIGKVVTAAASIITNFLRGIADNIGKIAKAGTNVITKWLKAIADSASKITKAGTNVIVAFVKGIGNAAARVVTAALKTATKFITTVAAQIPKEVNRVATAVIKMMNALAGVIRKREPEFIQALGRIGIAIAEGIVAGLDGLGKMVMDKVTGEVKDLPKKAIKTIKGFFSKVQIPWPEGVGTAFSRAFTEEVLEHLRTFEDGFQKELATIGGAENIDFLYNLGLDIGNTFFDGLLEGMDRPEEDPIHKIQQVGFAFSNQLAQTRGEIETTILDSARKVRQANDKLEKLEDARRAANDIKGKKERDKRKAALDKDIADETRLRDAAQKTLDTYAQRLKLVKDTANFINTDQSYQTQLVELVTAKQKVADLNAELEKQIQNLADLKQEREDTFNKFSELPGFVTEDAEGNKIDPADQVKNYIASLSNADDVVGVFTNSLDTLQQMGLNRDTYKQLLDVGPAAQGFVNALIAAGPDAVNAINAADSDLRNAAGILADHTTDAMHDVGIKATQGLIDGLKVEIPKAVKAADDLAIAIIKAIKKRLKIKSPSQVFAEVGSYSVEGFAQGFTDSSKLVTDAVYGVSDDAKAAIKKSMRGISDIVSAEISPNPTITPILDLSQIKAGAGQIGSILPSTTIGLASGISVPGAGEDPSKTGEAAPIQFIQNNNSPESLSSIEIYRQTKNQLSQARPVLAK